jgi:PTS system fructose-specific IIC component
MLGSATGSAASMVLGVSMPAPHGGIFVVPLSNKPFLFVACILLGSAVTAAVATLVKPDYEESVTTTESTKSTAQTND